MEDYRLEQSGQEVQDILNGAAMQSDLTAETERATEAEQTLQGNIDIEERDRKAADLTLQGNIDAEETRAKAAEKQNADDIDALEEKVPSGASSSNKLATESYVDDSVATATATFRGTYNLVSDLHLTVNATEQQIATALALAISTADNNDYCFVQVPTSSETPTEIKDIDRYKFNGTAWSFEYKLNNSGFTAAQWAAINSGITSGDVTKLAALPTNAELTTLLAGKQDVLTFDNVPTEGSSHPVKSGGVYSAIDDEKTARENADSSLSSAIEAILLLIPSAATSLNKLADKSFVNSSIATASATFRGTYNLVTDLSLTVSATHAQIATALAGAVSDEDNNDYAFVQIPTSDATPTQIAKTERYKFNGTAWEYEYDLNNSGYTAAQWAAINSGITEALVTKLSALPTNTELTSALGVLTSSITTINQKIPSAASQANQLVDTAALESYIVQVLDVLTASFNVTSTDGHVTVSISQVDGKITSFALTTLDIASAASLSLVEGRVTTAEGNISTNSADIAILQDAYAALTQSALVVVQPTDTWPVANPEEQTIYRVVDRVNTPPQYYSDYMWNGTTMVLMATYNNAIDPRPKKASQNLVTSGGVFDNMGALDVSELNATENPHTLAKYIDLSSALAAVPTDYQKGGMSIKYVRTSDNKYVQYRLMLSTFTAAQFTNVVNWQGVDEGPVADSKNLVESGGVYPYNQLYDGKLYYENITASENTILFSNKFIKSGDILHYSISNVDTTAVAIAFFDANNTRISYIGWGSATSEVETKEGNYTIPSNFSYCKVIWGNIRVNSLKINSTNILDILGEIEKLQDGLILCSRASISFNGNDVVIGSGYIYIRRGKSYLLSYNHTTEETFTLSNNTCLVINKSTQIISVVADGEVTNNHWILLWKDASVGIVKGGLLYEIYQNYTNNEIHNTLVKKDGKGESNTLICCSRAAISVDENKFTIGSGYIYILRGKLLLLSYNKLSETTHTFGSGINFLVINASTKEFSIVGYDSIGENDYVLIGYDSSTGKYFGGLLYDYYQKYIFNSYKVEQEIILPTNATPLDLTIASIHGATTAYPQNCKTLYRLAAKNRILTWECDVRPCLDGYVLSHNDDLVGHALDAQGQPISEGEWLCSQKTVAQLQTLKTGTRNGTTLVSGFENDTILTFEEYLVLAKSYRAVPTIEIKFNASDAQIEELYNIVVKYNMQDKVIWGCYANRFSHANKLVALNPKSIILLTFYPPEETNTMINNLNACASYKTYDGQIFAGLRWQDWLDNSEGVVLLDYALSLGLKPAIWPEDNSNNFATQLNSGICYFMTNMYDGINNNIFYYMQRNT